MSNLGVMQTYTRKELRDRYKKSDPELALHFTGRKVDLLEEGLLISSLMSSSGVSNTAFAVGLAVLVFFFSSSAAWAGGALGVCMVPTLIIFVPSLITTAVLYSKRKKYLAEKLTELQVNTILDKYDNSQLEMEEINP